MKKIMSEWKWTIGGAIGILVFGLALRLYSLTVLPVFADEAIYIRWAQVMRAESTLRFLPLSDGKQPLFMWLVIPFLKVFSDPLVAGRMVSVVAGMGTLIGIFALSYLVFKNKKVSLVACLIYAISPLTFFFDRMALVDSLLAMFGVWTLFFGILTAKTLRLDFAMITGFALGGALLTKSPAIFYVILLPMCLLYLKKSKDALKIVPLFLISLIIGYGMYGILRLGPNFHLIASRNQDYVLPLSHLWTNPKDPFIFHIEEIFKDWFIKMGPWSVLLLTAFGLLTTARKYKKELIVLGAWFIIPLLVQSMYAKTFTVRYILFSLPYLFIITASLFERESFKVFSRIIFTIFLLQALKFDYALLTNPDKANLPSSERSGYLEEWTAGTGIKEVSNYLKTEEQNNPKAKIVVGTEGYFGTLPDGLQMYLQDKPKITVIGVGLSLNEVPESLKDSFKAGNKTYLVINSSRLNIKEENYAPLGLKLINLYRKADRREKDTHEFIWYGSYDNLYLFEVIQPSIK